MTFSITYDLTTLPEAIPAIIAAIGTCKTIALVGDLGAGKTTLVSYIAAHLGVQDEVSSPTFSLINEYSVSNHADYDKILHSDWYRIEDENEAIEAGIEDMLYDEQALKFIEWPSKAEGLIPQDTLLITIQTIDAQQRTLTIQPYFE